MDHTLRALVLGTGFAGKGHTAALRDAGVEVVGIAGRTPAVVQAVANELQIPYASSDWQRALAELRPEIVAVGTPGGAHVAPITAALEQGCHVLCDKPLATTASEARALYLLARRLGRKTAYAASYRYQPQVLLAKELVAAGVIGEPQEVECISHYQLNPLIPFGWSHRLDQGGGRLNNNFTHKLALVLQVLDGRVRAVAGEARSDLQRAPLVAGVHDFREREQFAPQPEQAAALEWRAADADWSYSVLARIASPHAPTQPVSALFKHSGLQPRFGDDSVAFYGSAGALHIGGAYAQGRVQIYRQGGWQELALPAHITAALPQIADDTQRNWAQLARAFVADIRGQPAADYQSFRDGWIFQEVIDAVRAGAGWAAVPEEA